jgi:hypothetical protein
MGQPVTAIEEPSTRPDVVRIRINRSLTGMGNERYVAGQEILDRRPVDELAKRLFERGGIDAVQVQSNVITIDLADGADAEGLTDIVENLFIYYREGVTPEPVPEG